MKKKIFVILVVILSIILLFATCIKNETTKSNIAEQKTGGGSNDINDTIVEENYQFIVNNLSGTESGAKGTVQILCGSGCKKIIKMESFNDNGKCYSMTFIDKDNNKFYTTMSYNGYVGTVKNEEGEYLYAPAD